MSLRARSLVTSLLRGRTVTFEGKGPVAVLPIEGIPEVEEGADIGKAIAAACEFVGLQIEDDDVVVVTQKIVSKAEGRVASVDPADPDAKRRIVEQEAARILRRRGGLIIAETRHGFVCANAGVDQSNIDQGRVTLLPLDPDRSARRIRKQIGRAAGVDPAVIISDTFGRAWRSGQINVAIGVAGMLPVIDYRGTKDQHGQDLHVTMIAVADEIASAAELVMGKSDAVPAAIVRGARHIKGRGRARSLVRNPQDDLFR